MFFKSAGNPHFLVLSAVLQLIISATGCSVREDRDLCPCVLSLDFSGNDSDMLEDGIFVMVRSSDKGVRFSVRDTVTLPLWAEVVPRTELRIVSVWPAASLSRVPENGDGGQALVVIRPGEECPEVWMDSKKVYASGETECEKMTVHKNFCRLTVSVRNVSGAEFPYRMEIRGNVSGYDLDGQPMRGMFISPVGESVRIPRQLDTSLMLDVISEDDSCRSFAVGNYIAASGYDWTSPDLKDISMEIDYSETGLSFKIGAWQKSVNFEVVI